MINIKYSVAMGDRLYSCDYKSFNFPAGEKHVKNIPPLDGCNVDINFIFEKNEDLIELILVVDAIRNQGGKPNVLFIPYMPGSPQDRVCEFGEPFTLRVFAKLINNLQFRKVIVVDPHSDVTPALLKNCEVVHQSVVVGNNMNSKSEYWGSSGRKYYLLSPDGGSLKKIHKVGETLCRPVNSNLLGIVRCDKLRDTKTGAILETVVYKDDFGGVDAIIVDDICVGGLTFIEIAKVIKERNVGKIILMVTHGVFSRGLDVFDGIIDEVYTRNGKVYPC